EHIYQTVLTCDVDWPYNPMNRSVVIFLKQLAKDIVREKSFLKFLLHSREFILTRLFGWQYDSHNTFKYMMDLAERNDIKMVFYFICDNTAGAIDGNYSVDDPRIENLMQTINARGHMIGLHGSYNSSENFLQMSKEVDILKNKLRKLNINQNKVINRQHYLRFDASSTLPQMDRNNIDYDSSMGFADHPGFRSGTCYIYSAYDLIGRKKLKIKLSPLIAMEASVISSSYMSLGYTDKALEIFLKLKRQCQIYNGTFVLLWHNSFFFSQKDRTLLERILINN